MDYPAVPTDNLYKFIALAGLVLAVFSITYPAAKVVELQIATAETQAQRAKLEIEIEDVERVLSGIEKKKDPSAEEVAALRERYQQSRLKTVDLKKSLAIVEVQLEWAQRYARGAIAGSAIGALFSLVGFRLWHVRVQKPNDKLLAKQISESA